MSLMIDLMHLTIIVAGVTIGAFALVFLRRRMPRGRFVVFGAGSGGALFGCAALSGEVGLVPPATWFALVMAAMLAVTAIALRTGRATTAAD